jgi:hypothetical protein
MGFCNVQSAGHLVLDMLLEEHWKRHLRPAQTQSGDMGWLDLATGLRVTGRCMARLLQAVGG